MASVDQLAKLLQAIASENWTRARAIGRAVADAEEERGHHSAAQHLRGALQPNGHVSRGIVPPAEGDLLGDPGLLTAALTRLNTAVRLDEIALRRGPRRDLVDLIQEWRHQEELAARRIPRRSRLLFHGPPGCGKSLTAQAIGNELDLPTYVIRIDAVVGAYLGQTALRIRELFRFAEATPCVLLLDEIDALGKRRGNQLDVGELDRVVISLMQELEHAKPTGLVVATSNLPQLLDEALFRRFDQVVEFPRPTKAELRRFSVKRVSTRKIVGPGAVPRLLRQVSSYADAERRIADEERSKVLREITG
jgi:SpoVK/Ycf46/Vps4 family AAA+-type ATPase